MKRDGIERRIEMLRKSLEARRSPKDREYRSGAVKFSDAVTELMAYLKRDEPTANPLPDEGGPVTTPE